MRESKTIALAAALVFFSVRGYCYEAQSSAKSEKASRGWVKKIVIFPFEEDQELITGEKAVFLVELVDKEIKNALGRSFQVIKVFVYSGDGSKETDTEGKTLKPCDRDCRLSKAKESGIDYAVLNETTKFWDSWAVTLELFDLKAGRTVKSVSAGCDGSPKELINVVNDLASELADALKPLGAGAQEKSASERSAETSVEPSVHDYTAVRAAAHGMFWSGLVMAGVGLPMALIPDKSDGKAGWLILASGGGALMVGGAAIGLVLLDQVMKREKKNKEKGRWVAAAPVADGSGFVLSLGQSF